MSDEIYKIINNFSNYEISNFGNLRNKTTKNIIKSSIKSGYLTVSLKDDNGERKSIKIHRLVALTFIPNLENKPFIHHINFNSHDNSVDNLCWATMNEIMEYYNINNKKFTNEELASPM